MLFKKKKTTLDISQSNLVQDPEDPNIQWLEFPDGLRLIFRNGKYIGWYALTLTDPLR